QLAHHAAGRMLDLLHIRIDDQLARRDHSARELGGDRPAADTAHQQEAGCHSEQEMPIDGPLRAHDAAPCVRMTKRAGAGVTIGIGMAGTGLTKSFSTTSFGPNACWRPARITSIVSTPASALGRWAITTTMPPRSRTPR